MGACGKLKFKKVHDVACTFGAAAFQASAPAAKIL